MSAMSSLRTGLTHIDFPRRWRTLLTASAIAVVIAIAALAFRGLNLGIEFSGGQAWELRSDTTSVEDLRSTLEPFELGDARIQVIANDLYRVRSEVPASEASTEFFAEIGAALAETAGIEPDDVATSAVGASWGGDVTRSAVRALAVFFVVIFLYISLRLEWRMAVAALIAVAHDILLTVGIYAVFHFEVTAATVIAFLTILGYSLYDTLIVFDRIRDNERRMSNALPISYSGLVSYSLNQVFVRSLNTTITSILPILAVLIVGRFILGAVALQEFSIALLIGLLVGTYSSLFVAAPVLAWLKEREPGNVERRERFGDSIDQMAPDEIAREMINADRARSARAKARADGEPVRRITATTGARRTTADKQIGDSDAPTSRTDPSSRPTPSGDIPPRPRKRKKK